MHSPFDYELSGKYQIVFVKNMDSGTKNTTKQASQSNGKTETRTERRKISKYEFDERKI